MYRSTNLNNVSHYELVQGGEQEASGLVPRQELAQHSFFEHKSPLAGRMEEGPMISARSTFLFVCVVVVSLAMVASAAPAGDFTARYSLGAPAAAGEAVQITISLAVANNTSSDITNATIALHDRSEEHTSELQSPDHLVCRLLLEKKKKNRSCLT